MQRGVVVASLATAAVCWLHAGAGAHGHGHGHARRIEARPGTWFQAPRFLPGGDALVVSGAHYRGLWRLPVDGGAPQKLTDDAGAGVDARVSPTGDVVYTTTRDGWRNRVALDPATGKATVLQGLAPAGVAVASEGQIFVEVGGDYRQVATGDQYFGPVLSPDARRVAFVGLATGIWVFDRTTQRLHHAGRGTAPSWSADSARLIYERTLDDGHQVVASELFVWTPAAGSQAITSTAGRIERRPSFSPDGKRFAFDDDRGRVFVAEVPR